MRKCLVLAGAYSIGLSRLPKVLFKAGCEVTVLGWSHTLARRSRYTATFIRSGHQRGDILAAFRAHMMAGARYDLVVLGDDAALMLMADQWHEPWVEEWLPFPRSAEGAAIATDKLSFGRAMLAAGAPYPPSVSVRTRGEADAAASQLGYPVVLKAGHGCMGERVRIVTGPGDLDVAYAALNDGGALQVQQFVAGRSGCTLTLHDRGRLVAFAPALLDECFPGPTGPSCARTFITHPQMQAICQTVGDVTGYHGFGGVDWILDPLNQVHVVEFNARAIPGYHFARRAGVDFSAALRSMLAGEHRPVPEPRGGAKVYMFPQHLLRCHEQRNWTGLRRHLPLGGRSDVPWDDHGLLVDPAWQTLTTRRTSHDAVAGPV